jgi:hypothetical protein
MLNKYKNGLKLRPDLLIREIGNNYHFSGPRSFTINGLSEEQTNLIIELKKGISEKKLKKVLGKKTCSSLIIFFEKMNLFKFNYKIKDNGLMSRQLSWLSYNTQDPEEEMKDLGHRVVSILGCGGTGSIIATHLVRSGVRKIILIDHSKVDAPDLNRQLPYLLSDIGKDKTVALRDHLLNINEDLDIITRNLFIKSPKDLEEICSFTDLIVSCVDTPMGKIHSVVTEASIISHKPVLFGGVSFDQGTVGPLLVSTKAKKNYLKLTASAAKHLSKHNKIMSASLCHTNTIISSMMSLEIFNYLRINGESQIIDKSYDYYFKSGERKSIVDWRINENQR